MPTINHIHTYVRITGSSKRFKCAHPDCSHTESRGVLSGNRSLCNHCGAEFILTTASLKLAKPHCSMCFRVTPQNQHMHPDIPIGTMVIYKPAVKVQVVDNLADVLEDLGI